MSVSYHRLARVVCVGGTVLVTACGGPGSSTTGGGGASTTSAASVGTSTGASTGSASGTGGATTTSSVTGTSTGTGKSTSTGTGGAGGMSSGTGGVSMASASASGATSSNASNGASSSSASASSSSGGPTTFLGGCNGAHTVLTGVVVAPNGMDPIPNVRVYAASQVNPYPDAYCGKCSLPIDTALAATVTGPDGTFSLNLDAVPKSAAITFVIQIGRFRKVTTLNVTACQTTILPNPAPPPNNPAPECTLPGATALNSDIPKIAVSAGNADHLDAVLKGLGITEYDCYEGRKGSPGTMSGSCKPILDPVTMKPVTIADVLQDSDPTHPHSINKYHMAFLSCAPHAYKYFITPTSAVPAGAGNDQALMTTNTQAWVATNNGRLFATDTAYDYIAQAFPTGITWAGPGGSPQPVDGANIGCSPPGPPPMTGPQVPYTVTIDDPLLAKWLEVGVHVLPTPPPNPAQVNILGFYKPWAAISSLPATTQLIANGTVPVDPTYPTTKCSAAATQLQNVPLTTQFDVPTCGRVIFSSYHTDVGAAANSAQQRIMEYLIFDAAFCHQ